MREVQSQAGMPTNPQVNWYPMTESNSPCCLVRAASHHAIGHRELERVARNDLASLVWKTRAQPLDQTRVIGGEL